MVLALMLGTGWLYGDWRTFVYSSVVLLSEIAMYISFVLSFWILVLLFLVVLFLICLRERLSPGESWAGGPLNPLVRLRGRWGCHMHSVGPKLETVGILV